VGRADHRASLRHGVVELSRHAEVGELDARVGSEQHVGRLGLGVGVGGVRVGLGLGLGFRGRVRVRGSGGVGLES
jgi:hypothetical protein